MKLERCMDSRTQEGINLVYYNFVVKKQLE